MFGLALRAYQKKMRRLTESRSARDRTLWEAVLSFVGEADVTRKRIEERFQHDGPREVGAVLHDCPGGFEDLAALNGMSCNQECAVCFVPDSTCGARCVQPCDGEGPAWSIYCTE
jgi:hypothetical protein